MVRQKGPMTEVKEDCNGEKRGESKKVVNKNDK